MVCGCASYLQLNESDQKLYRRFNLLVPDRWQVEMMGMLVLETPFKYSVQF